MIIPQHVENDLREREELISALDEACDVAIWMSGSDDFGPNGKAFDGWQAQRERLWHALGVLAKVKAEQNTGRRPE